jgi:hypothetical protein
MLEHVMTRSQKLLHLPVLVAVLIVGATFPISAVEPRVGQGATVYRDVTDTHVPAAPDLHALDAIFVDVDGDGDLDVVLAVENGENRLYLNDGEGRLAWKRGALGTAEYDTEHVLSADFNADGYPDLIFVAEDDKSHQFFLGGRGGEFAEVTDRLPALSEGNGLAVGDVNGDGFPDIVIGNSGSESGQNFLWLNDPERPGHFTDATATHLPAVDDDTQDIVLVDLDGDDDLDMLVANETPPSRLLLNDGEGRFSDASERLDLVAPFETRQMHVFDANGDGSLDILMLNLTSNNQGWDKDPQVRLLINDGQGRFIDETVDRVPLNTFSTWGGTIVDFNHDAAPDIIVGPIQVPGFVPLQVRAYANDGSGRFSDVTPAVIPEETIGRSWGMAVGDLDSDGVDDIFIGGWGTQARLLLSRPKP